MSTRRWLILIVAVGGLLRLFPIWFGLPYLLARPDEEVATRIAVQIASGDLNPRFFNWPSFTFYVFAALYGFARALKSLASVGSSLTPAEQIIIARVFIACAGTATLVLVFRIGRRIQDDSIGLIAASLLAVAILHVRESHFAMTDVLMTLLVSASLAMLLRGIDEPCPRKSVGVFAAAGFAGGLAASTKYSAAAVLAALCAAQLLVLSQPWRTVASLRVWRPSFAYVACFACGFVAATPFAVLDFATFKAGIVFNYRHLSTGHGVQLGRGFIYHPTHSLPYGLGITAFAAGLVGLVLLALRYRKHAFVLLSFFFALYLSLGNGQTVFFRYVLPLVPLMCLAAAIAIDQAATWLSTRTSLSRAAALAALLLVTVVPGLINSIWFDLLLARTDSRVIAGRWLEERLQPADTLYDGGGIFVELLLRRSDLHQEYFDEFSRSFGHPEGKSPDWLVLYESPVSLYAKTMPVLQDLAQREYVLVQTVNATGARAGSAVYDRQDAFFMPLSGFWTVERPGPTIRIYKRKDLR